jgi:uncharacterized membrane protein YjjP (DUF1212 family)
MSSAAKAREMETNATSAMDNIILIVLESHRVKNSKSERVQMSRSRNVKE